MDTNSRRQKREDSILASLNVAIEGMNHAKDSGIEPTKVVFGHVGTLLTVIRDSMANKIDYVELGLACAYVCKALERGTNGKRADELSPSVLDAIAQLTTTVTEIQKKVAQQNRRNAISRLIHAKNDKEMIAAWRLDLNRILIVFNTELRVNTTAANVHQDVVNTRSMVSDTHRNIVKSQEGIDTGNQSHPRWRVTSPTTKGLFGRDELIERIINLAENLTPIALVGPGGIGKSSIALTVLHHDRIKQQFGKNRWFIRCDGFPATRTHFLSQLSKTIGAGVKNPGDLGSLKPFLVSRVMILFLDGAESLLDPQGVGAQEIYTVVEELSQFSNICLCITSRISTIPPTCKILYIPTLSMEAARDTFYHIYMHGEQSSLVDNILKYLDFHPLSITLLATITSQNNWDYDRLAREWNLHHTQMLQTGYNNSLAATIVESLASPTFHELGPSAHELLGVIAFFPQGINQNNIDWLFPTIPSRRSLFDKFCVLSLTHQSNGFITMLAPIRDYLCPRDPLSSSLLCTTKDYYFSRLSVHVNPNEPGFEDAQWIVSEDVNVEHLLNVFTSIDTNSVGVWDTCAYFMEHLYWHKPRPVILGPKIEGLPKNHPSKPQCLLQLSQLSNSIGNYVKEKQLLIHTLELWKEQGDDFWVAQTLRSLAGTNRLLGLYKEGIVQAKEALGIYTKLDDVLEQAISFQCLAWLLCSDGQLDAAEKAVSQATTLLPDKGEKTLVCQCYHLLGVIYLSRGEKKKAINYFETALSVASSFNWHSQLFSNHYSLAELFSNESRFGDAHTHIEHAKSHAINNLYHLGCVMQLQARILYKESRFQEAKSKVLYAVDVFEKLGAMKDVESCRVILWNIQESVNMI